MLSSHPNLKLAHMREGGDPCIALLQLVFFVEPWIPAYERVKKSGWPAANSAVMARLDRAIHERDKNFSKLLDGRVKPGHDNGSRGNFFTRSQAGIQ